MTINRRTFLTGASVAAALLPRTAKAGVTGFADALIAGLAGYSTGVQITVADRAGSVVGRSSGAARLPISGYSRAMSNTEKITIASASKTITATAMLRALWDNQSISLDSPFTAYLPAHWTIGPNLKNVTFRQLLQHRSGFFSTPGLDYASLKSAVAKGVQTWNIGNYKYTSINYALMRLLIPRVASYNIIELSAYSPYLFLEESAQATQFATDYMNYVQKKVWDKTSVAPAMQCMPIPVAPALCYQYVNSQSSGGDDFGDFTLTCGASGWNASSHQLAVFMRTVFETQLILPFSVSQSMITEVFGFDSVGQTTKGMTYFQKGGYYPGAQNGGELHSYVIGFSNGVYVGLIINSQFTKGTDIFQEVLNAFDSSY